MKPENVFNRYDIRGDYPEEIDEEFAGRIGKAVGTRSVREGRGKVVVGRDSRESSKEVHRSLVEGIRETGANVVDVGEGTTDRTALAASHYGGTGVMVTASHHSWDRTGFKLIYEEGNGFSNKEMDRIEEMFHEGNWETGEGTVLNEQSEFDEHYVETLEEVIQEFTDDIDGKIVLDATGGSSRTAPWAMEELGIDFVEHGRDSRPSPEPTEEDRQDVKELIEREDADLAVGYDPDGDRVYAIHPELGWIDGDRIFYLLARIVEPETIAASIDTSPVLEDTGAEVEYSRVGDIFVSEKGIGIDADMTGEPNGHYAVPEFSWYSSGILASLLLSSVADQIPAMLKPVEEHTTYRYVERYSDMERRDEAMSEVKKKVAQGYELVSTLDGMKFRDRDTTALVRPSGTSPKIRLKVHTEGDAEIKGKKLQDEIFG